MLVRDYCDQKLDERLNELVDTFLRKLNELQERLRERDAIKAKMKRRLQVPRRTPSCLLSFPPITQTQTRRHALCFLRFGVWCGALAPIPSPCASAWWRPCLCAALSESGVCHPQPQALTMGCGAMRQSGLREVHRSIRTQEARVVFVAPNIEPSPVCVCSCPPTSCQPGGRSASLAPPHPHACRSRPHTLTRVSAREEVGMRRQGARGRRVGETGVERGAVRGVQRSTTSLQLACN